ncbi:MAG TPA: response regulator transcription factor, partial [Acidimicrobiia bacterium]|nr:response regulator transcription factor [Acidimicrobiia bacterium]
RVHALLRRAERTPDRAPGSALDLGGIHLDLEARVVTVADAPVHLTPTEFDLIAYLAKRPNRVFSREQLLGDVWGYRSGAGGRTVDSHVRALRAKLGTDAIRTVHGVGYAAGAPA